ncbi:hypothetical protein KSZ_44480 [Dictyobacter formicarum]|uniref:Uncharacterized protein n=1 Tax=Dictyobacter formicarum TaxID=2778368 RepID=A0ABQ3VJQ2_9CHLR|nr:hypothetical protein KSZ_44480 [Dictyobacter formicarum]
MQRNFLVLHTIQSMFLGDGVVEEHWSIGRGGLEVLKEQVFSNIASTTSLCHTSVDKERVGRMMGGRVVASSLKTMSTAPLSISPQKDLKDQVELSLAQLLPDKPASTGGKPLREEPPGKVKKRAITRSLSDDEGGEGMSSAALRGECPT